MTWVKKSEFLYRLDGLLSDIPRDDAKRSLDYYAEMIDERIESGMSEEDAVAELGTPEDIAAQIVGDITPNEAVNTKKRTRKPSALTVILLILGAPVWISLLVAAFAVIFSLYASLWAVIISLWAAFGSVAASSVAALAAGIGTVFTARAFTGVALIGASLVLAGLAIFLFCICKAATDGAVLLTKRLSSFIKRCFSKKEAE